MDKKGKMRAAEWALKRHYDGKSKLSPYQLRKLEKSIMSTQKQPKNVSTKATKMTAEDMDELKRITKRANYILNKYK